MSERSCIHTAIDVLGNYFVDQQCVHFWGRVGKYGRLTRSTGASEHPTSSDQLIVVFCARAAGDSGLSGCA
ncbi:hypothetical protein KY285_000168 [Solanum tuberosum]|nr:hypothetical protein KY284_000187 [Solanum tuberosum]KAH0764297.1 hypothetical protein KY285_000168 [Solanum tuberosum]